MARSRTLKPEFWTDDVIVELSFAARLWYQGFWNFALCDQGHIDASPKSLKMKIFPADDVDPVALTEELIAHGRVVRKETPDGHPYLHVGTLVKHTRMETRWTTRCPYCALEGLAKPASTPPTSDEHAEPRARSDEHAEPHDVKGREGKGRERKGKEGEEQGAPRKRGARIPDDFAVNPDMVAWAKANAPNVDGRRETEKFINHWRAKTGAQATKLDWVLTWRNWLLTAQQDAERYRGRASPQQVEHNGMLLRPETVADIERTQRFAALDAQDAEHQLAIGGLA